MKKLLTLMTLLTLIGGVQVLATDYTWTFDGYCTDNEITSGNNADIPRSATTIVAESNGNNLSYVTGDNSNSKIYNMSSAATVNNVSYSSYLYMGGSGNSTPTGNLRYFTTGTITGKGKLTIVYAGTVNGTCYIYASDNVSSTDNALCTITPVASSAITSESINLGSSGKGLTICHNAKCYIYAIIWTEESSGPEDVSFSLSSTTIDMSSTAQIIVNNEKDLNGLTMKDLSYDNSIISISSTGLITPIAEGSSNITFTTDAVEDTYNAGSASLSITVVADISGQSFYSWNQGTQSGGTAVASDGESVGVTNSSYTTIRLNGKSDFSDKTVTITLENALKAGDLIKVTAYRNKNDNNKQAGFKAKFENGSATVASSTGLEFVNINEAVSGTDEYGTEPNTCTFSVPASAAGSKTITMTRSHTATNLFITKIEIYRPAIALDAVLNAEGLLTADEISNTANFSFGVTSSNVRVAADAANAVAVISGKYHNDHGCTGLNVVANVPGKVKITIGQCTFSKSTITIKNSSDVVVAQLTPNNPACWKNSTSNIYEFYYGGDATTLTISGMTYCPYVGIQEVDEVPAISGTITATGYNTFSSCYPLDLSTISGGTAYVASSVTNGKVVMTKSTGKVPAGTGLFIAGTKDAKFTIDVTYDAVTNPTNLFVGAPDGIEVPVADEGYNYVFGWQEVTNPGFYKVVSDLPTIGAGKAYLHTTDELTVPSASRLAIAFEEDITGISTVEAVESADNAVYNLRGQRVTKPTKGLFIVNGKKVIMN